MSGARLVRPCHGSTYYCSGQVLRGPAQRALLWRFPVTRSGDELASSRGGKTEVRRAVVLGLAARYDRRGAAAGHRRRHHAPAIRAGRRIRQAVPDLLGRTAIRATPRRTPDGRKSKACATRPGSRPNGSTFSRSRASDFGAQPPGAELEVEEGGREIKLEDNDGHRPPDQPEIRAARRDDPGAPRQIQPRPRQPARRVPTDRPRCSTSSASPSRSRASARLGRVRPAARRALHVRTVRHATVLHLGLIDDSEAGTRIALGRGNFEDNGSPRSSGASRTAPRWTTRSDSRRTTGRTTCSTSKARRSTSGATSRSACSTRASSATTLGGEAGTHDHRRSPGLTGIYASRQHDRPYLEAGARARLRRRRPEQHAAINFALKRWWTTGWTTNSYLAGQVRAQRERGRARANNFGDPRSAEASTYARCREIGSRSCAACVPARVTLSSGSARKQAHRRGRCGEEIREEGRDWDWLGAAPAPAILWRCFALTPSKSDYDEVTRRSNCDPCASSCQPSSQTT